MNAPVNSHYYVICGRVFDPEKRNFSARILEVKQGKFVSVTPLVEFPKREIGVEVFDLLHYSLLPLMVDARVHLSLEPWPLDPGARIRSLDQPSAVEQEAAFRRLKTAFLSGVGLVRDMGDPFGVGIAMEKASTGREGYPMVLTAGRGVSLGSECRCLGGVVEGDREGVARAVRRLVDDPRIQFIRLVLSSVIDCETVEVPPGCRFGWTELRLAVQIAHEHGKVVIAECRGDEGTRAAVEAGADFIEHGYCMSEKTMDLLGEKRLVWTPVFAPLRAKLDHAACCGLSDGVREHLGHVLEQHAKLLRYAYGNGVRILAGSDAGRPGVPFGGGLIRELEIMQEAGLPADELLAMATSRSAVWIADETPIAPGMPANFLAVRGSVRRKVGDLTRIEWVARDGKVTPAVRPKMESDSEAETYGVKAAAHAGKVAKVVG